MADRIYVTYTPTTVPGVITRQFTTNAGTRPAM